MSDAIQVSKLRYRLVDQADKPLTVAEAFYLGTKGGGSFFGKVGSFEAGYEFDAVVIDDSTLCAPFSLSLEQRLERVVYLSDDSHILDKYVRGRRVSVECRV
jgi:guanine deaminase